MSMAMDSSDSAWADKDKFVANYLDDWSRDGPVGKSHPLNSNGTLETVSGAPFQFSAVHH